MEVKVVILNSTKGVELRLIKFYANGLTHHELI